MTQEASHLSVYNQDLFRLIAENVDDFAIFAIDLKGYVASWNRGVEKLLGYTEEEWIGSDACRIFTPEDNARDACAHEMNKAGDEGRAEDQRWHVRKDGTSFWANGLMMSLRDDAGNLRGYTKIMREDTKRKIMEDRLRESEAFCRSVLESSADCIKVLDINGNLVSMNQPGMCIMEIDDFGEFAGRCWTDLWSSSDSHEDARQAVEAAKQGKTSSFRGYADTAKGTRKYWDVNVSPIFDGAGQPMQVLSVSRDITGHRQIEEERERLLQSLEVERSRLTNIFAQAPAFVAIVRGPEHIFELANPAYLQLTGHRDLIGKKVREAFPEVVGQGFFELLDKVLQTGESCEGSEIPLFLQREPDGLPEQKYVDFLYQPLFEEDGLVSGIFVHGVDITEQVSARKEAEEANRLKDEFLATLSHELRTPLTSILGWAQMLKSGNLKGNEARRALEIIERNARSQNNLIGDILDVSRIITGKLRLDVRPVELSSVIEAAADSVRPAAEARSVRLQILLDSAAGQVSGDADRLQQVVWNLLTNAVKFTPKGGRVQLRLERVNSHVEINVADTGQGIEAEFLPHVFDRFRQADQTSTRSHGGLGLGLSIVRQLVELHGGTVHAESEGIGHGAIFVVRLPLMIARRQPLESSDRKHSKAGGNASLDCPPQLMGLRVLVVEDEEDSRELLRAILEECGSEVTVAASAAEAIRQFERSKPDIFLSDIGMPEEDGYELIGRVRALEDQRGDKRVPAIALTAYARMEDRVRALNAGFQVHVPKPIEPVELVAVVASLAGRTGRG